LKREIFANFQIICIQSAPNDSKNAAWKSRIGYVKHFIRNKGRSDTGSIYKTGGYISYGLSARPDADRPVVNSLLAMPLVDFA
jgi:hypothetical protein